MMNEVEREQAQEDIEAFVHWVLQFLGRLREAGNLEAGNGLLFDPAALEQVGAAWQSFMADFEGWEVKVRNPERDAVQRLQVHGLYGPQLHAKLWLVFYFYAQFLNSLPARTRDQLFVPIALQVERAARDAQAAAAMPNQPGRTSQGILKTLIEAIDIPLDSIIAALGLNGSITEIKKMLGVSIPP